jgi:CRP-like cAMP-binding protein
LRNGHTNNRLLDATPPAAFEAIADDLEPVELTMRHVISEPDQPSQHAYFPVSGMCSAIAISDSDDRVEMGLIGREGFVGVPILLLAKQAPLRVVVQGPGRALRLPAAKLLEASAMTEFRSVLLRFLHTFMVQVSSTILAHSAYLVEQRLARSILMSHDRMDTASFPVTHELMGLMLAVRRSGVTEAIHKLEDRGLIRASRGQMQVLNRAGLEDLADGCYGQAEREYRRLFPPRGVEETG